MSEVLMDSTPAPMPISYSPALIAAATLAIACSPLEHCRLVVVTGTVSGKPAQTQHELFTAISHELLTCDEHGHAGLGGESPGRQHVAHHDVADQRGLDLGALQR